MILKKLKIGEFSPDRKAAMAEIEGQKLLIQDKQKEKNAIWKANKVYQPAACNQSSEFGAGACWKWDITVVEKKADYNW